MILVVTSQITLALITLTIIGTVVVMARMILIPKRDIIETGETKLKIGLALYATLIYLLFLYAHAFFSHSGFGYEGKSYVTIIIILLAIYPSLYLVFVYVNLIKYFRKRYKITDESASHYSARDREVESSIEKIAEDLQLKSKPTIIYSNIKNISPFVFGKTSKSSYFVLPDKMEDIFRKISKDNKEIESSLNRFVILHELSHIKHGDHIFMGWAFSFLRSFKYWIVVVFLVAAPFSFILGLSEARKAFGPVLFGVVYYLVLYLITMSVSRSREYLADARASLFMPENEMEAITESKVDFRGEKISCLESLFLWFSIFSGFKTSALDISGLQTWPYKASDGGIRRIGKTRVQDVVLRYFNTYTHPNRKARIRELKEKHFVGTRKEILSKESLVWVGVILSLFYSAAIFYPLQISSSMARQGDLASLSIMSLGEYFYYLMAMLIPFLFYVSIRNAIALTTSFGTYFLSLLTRFLIIYGVFLLTGITLNSLLYLNDTRYRLYRFSDIISHFAQDYYAIYPIAFAGLLITTLMAFLHFNSISYTYNVRKSEFTKLMSTGYDPHFSNHLEG